KGGLPDRYSLAVLGRIRVTSPDRAAGAEADRHRLVALSFARACGIAIHPTNTSCRFNWNGTALNGATEAYVILHEVAHFALAPPARRKLVEFGLGPGSHTLDRDTAERGAIGARGGRGRGLTARDHLGGRARATGARLFPRSELARRARPLGPCPFHCCGRDITSARIPQPRPSARRFHNSQGRPRTALLVTVALAASSAFRKLTSPSPRRRASASSLALIS